MSSRTARATVLPVAARTLADGRALADALDEALPQTQCTRCGYPDCRSYAEAIVEDGAPINQCPPGGAEGIARLARITGRPVRPLNPANGVESPRRVALIDEAWCIGCTLCLKACPVDSIVGGAKLMHTVVDRQCTGCELCLPACPVDCISLQPTGSHATGWAAWSSAQAAEARDRYRFHQFRSQRDAALQSARLASAAAEWSVAASDESVKEPADAPPAAEPDKRAAIQAAIARAKAARGG